MALRFGERQRMYERLETGIDTVGVGALVGMRLVQRYEPTPSTPTAETMAEHERIATDSRAERWGVDLVFLGFHGRTGYHYRSGDRETTIDGNMAPATFYARLRAFAEGREAAA